VCYLQHSHYCKFSRTWKIYNHEHPSTNIANTPWNGIFTSMLERQHYSRIEAQLQKSAAVALLGPRQVGKTTLAHKLSNKLAIVIYQH
ncbi:MAG: hypothetical protein KTR16_00720, partial [Acidiferrobacterales bacterium]|nr:hypothetical protein [Acidiferrobacterales bacterium]